MPQRRRRRWCLETGFPVSDRRFAIRSHPEVFGSPIPALIPAL